MKSRFLRLAPLTILAACTGWTATIISGTDSNNQIGSSVSNTIQITGSNFSISGSISNLPASGPYLIYPACGGVRTTCTFDPTTTIQLSSASSPSMLNTFVYNGTTYNLGLPGALSYQATLTLNLSGSPVTVPETTNYDPNGGVPIASLTSWSNVPFSVTGTITVVSVGDPALGGGQTILSESLTGQGLASGGGEYGITRADSFNMTYQFVNPAPEPASLGLVGGSLLVAGCLARRRKQVR